MIPKLISALALSAVSLCAQNTVTYPIAVGTSAGFNRGQINPTAPGSGPEWACFGCSIPLIGSDGTTGYFYGEYGPPGGTFVYGAGAGPESNQQCISVGSWIWSYAVLPDGDYQFSASCQAAPTVTATEFVNHGPAILSVNFVAHPDTHYVTSFRSHVLVTIWTVSQPGAVTLQFNQ
jgi:hypothetical protein